MIRMTCWIGVLAVATVPPLLEPEAPLLLEVPELPLLELLLEPEPLLELLLEPEPLLEPLPEPLLSSLEQEAARTLIIASARLAVSVPSF